MGGEGRIFCRHDCCSVILEFYADLLTTATTLLCFVVDDDLRLRPVIERESRSSEFFLREEDRR